MLIGGLIGVFFCTAMIASSMLVAKVNFVISNIILKFCFLKYIKSLHWFSYVSMASVLAFVISFAAGPGD